MYLPKHFAENRPDVLQALMGAHPLATLVTLGEDGPVANHIPLHLDPTAGPHGTLRGHLARANPLANGHAEGQSVLAIFQGPACYISPSGYATKAEHGKVVPTWNYTAVHARGELRLIDDADWLLRQLDIQTTHQEAGRESPWQVDDAPADYIGKLLGAIVGLEIRLTALSGKWKVSQNQPAANQASLVAALGSHPMAELIAQHQKTME